MKTYVKNYIDFVTDLSSSINFFKKLLSKVLCGKTNLFVFQSEYYVVL
jgi:hypothetical protein